MRFQTYKTMRLIIALLFCSILFLPFSALKPNQSAITPVRISLIPETDFSPRNENEWNWSQVTGPDFGIGYFDNVTIRGKGEEARVELCLKGRWKKLNGTGTRLEIWRGEHDHDIAFDEINQILVYYDHRNRDTWTYNLTNESWVNVDDSSPYPYKLSEGQYTMIYSPDHKEIYLFGGACYWGDYYEGYSLMDMWHYSVSNNTWKPLPPGPSLQSHAMVYDKQKKNIVIFGGADENFDWDFSMGGPYHYCYYMNDTWTYDPNRDNWTKMNLSLHPKERVYHKMAYDPINQRTVLFGGALYETHIWGADSSNLNETHLFNDTWTFDSVNNLWENKTPLVHPSPRVKHTMLYDTQLMKILLFGGGYNESWTYDVPNNYWSKRYLENAPNVTWCQAEYDNVNDRIILFNEEEIWTCTHDLNNFIETGSYTTSNITLEENELWKTLHINKAESENNFIRVSIIDAKNNIAISGYENIETNGEINISNIDSHLYQSIRLRASFNGNGSKTPILFSWGVQTKLSEDSKPDDTDDSEVKKVNFQANIWIVILVLTIGIVVVWTLSIISKRRKERKIEQSLEEGLGRVKKSDEPDCE